MTYAAIDIANWFVRKAADFGELTTHLKVQKLLYYAEAWTQALLGHELFEEKIQAWAHGPVVPDVFQQFKIYNWSPLPVIDEDKLIKFDDHTSAVLEQVFETYGDIPAKQLEAMTHKDKPWIDARGDLAPEERCEVVIDKNAIKDFFVQKYKV